MTIWRAGGGFSCLSSDDCTDLLIGWQVRQSGIHQLSVPSSSLGLSMFAAHFLLSVAFGLWHCNLIKPLNPENIWSWHVWIQNFMRYSRFCNCWTNFIYTLYDKYRYNSMNTLKYVWTVLNKCSNYSRQYIKKSSTRKRLRNCTESTAGGVMRIQCALQAARPRFIQPFTPDT